MTRGLDASGDVIPLSRKPGRIAACLAKKTPDERQTLRDHAQGKHTVHRLDCPVCRKFGAR